MSFLNPELSLHVHSIGSFQLAFNQNLHLLLRLVQVSGLLVFVLRGNVFDAQILELLKKIMINWNPGSRHQVFLNETNVLGGGVEISLLTPDVPFPHRQLRWSPLSSGVLCHCLPLFLHRKPSVPLQGYGRSHHTRGSSGSQTWTWWAHYHSHGTRRYILPGLENLPSLESVCSYLMVTLKPQLSVLFLKIVEKLEKVPDLCQKHSRCNLIMQSCTGSVISRLDFRGEETFEFCSWLTGRFPGGYIVKKAYHIAQRTMISIL